MEIGDKVIISNYGRVYSKYEDMFIKMKFRNKHENEAKSYKSTTVYEIFDIQKHLNSDATLCGIRCGGMEVLINMEGLSLFEKKDKLNEWLDNKIKEFKTHI